MENASKALLIAAGVLIVILLIAFGMSVFHSTGDSAGQAEAVGESTSMQTFNAKFTGYLGNNKSATVARNLSVLVNQSNTANPNHSITLTAPAAGITDGQTYNITATYDLTTGYITAITIS